MNYDFFIAQLRFVAKKTDRQPLDVAASMNTLDGVIAQLETGASSFHVLPCDLRITARALAGVAGFFQQHILPEAVASKNTAGEDQIRWTIEACMSMMADLMAHAELNKDGEGMDVKLPARS